MEGSPPHWLITVVYPHSKQVLRTDLHIGQAEKPLKRPGFGKPETPRLGLPQRNCGNPQYVCGPVAIRYSYL